MANETLNNTPGGARRWITTIVVVLVLVIAVGAYVELRPHRIRVSVVKPLREAISSDISTNGKVEPIHGFEAHAPLAGTVEKILVKEGAQVKEGQLLLLLDDSRARADLATEQTRLKAAQALYADLLAGGTEQELLSRRSDLQKATTDRDAAQRQLAALQRLLANGAATADEVAAANDRLARANADLTQLQSQVRYSPLDLQHAQEEIDAAKASIQATEELLRNCNIRAPFDGTVYLIPVRADAFVNVGDLLLQEANLSQLQVRAFVDEPEIGHLALGQSVRITWDALPGHSWQGVVTTLPSTVVARGSRVVGEVLCKLENGDHLLLPNVDVNTTIIIGSKQDAITVPREAVREDGNRNFVYLLRDGHLHRQEVNLGISNLTRVEIASGVSEGDVIAVQSFSPSPMAEGVEVKVVENPA
ncbi:MAG: efflux RND transporter periplasmic adaptor subunit [Candidatus Korobacteraceae bacterium]